MRLLPSLAIVMALLAGGIVGDACARDRDRDRDQKHEKHDRRSDRSEARRRDEGRGDEGRYEARRRDEGNRDEGRYEERRRGQDRDHDRYFGGREASLVDRGSSSEGRSSSRMTAAQAARQAQHQYGGGRVLSVDSMGDGYRVKLLREGDVRVVFISDH
ncbi:MAG: hypothetical protein ACREUE_09575 [Panacagrimonas sp.]